MVPSFESDEARWAAFLARDPAADRLFYAGVTSTGIFCRSICPARPRRENVVFLASREACLAAGIRACKRCKP
jgi:AraC family transcriptional regulator of adaptative response/methylated-DNA-[protein]-cysteine methyltransferase